MKKLTLLCVLMMATGFVAVSNQAAAAGSDREGLSRRSTQKATTDRQFNSPAEINQGIETKVVPAAQANDADTKQLKLIFLLMISLGRYRTPIY